MTSLSFSPLKLPWLLVRKDVESLIFFINIEGFHSENLQYINKLYSIVQTCVYEDSKHFAHLTDTRLKTEQT